MIQIIALRPYFDEKTKKEKIKHELKTTVASVPELFKTIDTIINSIEPEQRYNLYYTALNCLEPAKHGGALRRFKSQEILPFDLDHTDQSRTPEYTKILGDIIGCDMAKVGQVATGNGLQYALQLDKPFHDAVFFEQKRLQYKAICDRINQALEKANLPGGADPSVWSLARILRLPNTENRKPKGIKQAVLLNGNIEPIAFDWDKASGVPELTVVDHLSEWNDKKAPKLDNKAIMSGCDFIKHVVTHPEKVREPDYYASLSIIARMENGRALAHKVQEAIRDSGSDSSVAFFAPSQVDDKIDQAVAASGPRTCTNINAIWGKCSKCPNFNKVTSPVSLKSPDFIATLETGFYKMTKKGGMVPAYDDLIKHFDNLHKFKTLNQNGMVRGWDGTHYIDYTPTMLKNFAVENFRPLAKQSYVNEFLNLVSEKNLVKSDFFVQNDGFRNFQNGVLNVETGALVPHDPNRGFRYVLPYGYDPNAKAPRFHDFLDEVTGGDVNLRKILEEFGGWALSGDEYWLHKCLLLSGEGKNGKSKFINALRMVAGIENVSALSLNALMESQNNRQLLEGKLFNIASEMSHRDMRDTDIFKRLTEGGVIDVKQMWYQPYMMENRTKLIFACNTIPDTTDQSYGFLRRMLIVPFNQTFEGKREDKFIDAKFKQELPGIFNIFLDGYKRLKAQGDFTESKASSHALKNYTEDNNPLTDFLFEYPGLVVNQLNGKCTLVTIDDLYAAFVDYNTVGESRDKKHKMMDIKRFGLHLRRALPNGKDRIERLQPARNWQKRVVFDVELELHGGDKTYLHSEGKMPILRSAESVQL